MPRATIGQADAIHYIEQGGGRCPSCRSSRLDHGSLTPGSGQVRRQVICNHCGAQWYDVYVLEHVEVRVDMETRLLPTGHSDFAVALSHLRSAVNHRDSYVGDDDWHDALLDAMYQVDSARKQTSR